MSVVKFQQLLPGTYTVQKFKPTQTTYGMTYIITALFNNEQIKFYANYTLMKYITYSIPTKVFDITINRQAVPDGGISIPYPNSVTIPGYMDEVVLQ